MKRTVLLSLCLALFFYCGTSPANNDALTNLEKDLQVKLDQLQQKEGMPGVTVGIVLPGGKEIGLASGLADIENKTKMKPTDRILMGSIGKTYVAAVALQLIKEGKFSLNDKISLYLGDEPWFKRLPNAEDITIYTLMNHSAGLPRYVYKEGFWEKINKEPDKVWKPEELLFYVFDDDPLYPTGEGWGYSDTDYIVLGMIIEKTTGSTYYDQLKKRVLVPFNLKDTGPSDQRRMRGLVPGYTSDHTPPFLLPEKMVKDGVYAINPQFEWTGGGLITTSLDLARYIKLLLEGKVVYKDYLDQMKQPVNEKSGKRDSTGYGLGLEVWKTPYGMTYGHRGTMPGYGSITLYVPDYGFSIAMQYNTDGLSGRLDKEKTRIDYIAQLTPLIVSYLKAAGEVK